MKYFKVKNDKLQKEIILVRHGVDNWRSEVNKINYQILDEINKEIEKDLNINKSEQSKMDCEFSSEQEHKKFRDNHQKNVELPMKYHEELRKVKKNGTLFDVNRMNNRA